MSHNKGLRPSLPRAIFATVALLSTMPLAAQAAWTRLSPTNSPSARDTQSMCTDTVRKVTVLFGYRSANDTWEWNGKNWKQIQLTCQPVARWGHSMTYSIPRGIVMFGGQTQLAPNNGLTSDVWGYDGRSWSEVKATGAPSARRLHATAIDPGSNRVLLFGGSVGGGETHTLDLKNFATAMYEPYGTSCKGPNGNPALGALNCNPPFLNETFTAQVTNIPSGAKTYLIFGVSNTTWGTYRLPMDLSGFGFTGCSLRASLDLFVTMSTSGTTASLAAKVPNDSNLVGTTFFNQAFVFDATANASGATLTNGAAGKIGRR